MHYDGFFFAQVEKAEDGKGYDVNTLMVDKTGENLIECGMRKHFRLKREAQEYADLHNNGDGGQYEFTREELEKL